MPSADCVQHEICFLPLFVRREITQQVWRCSSHHIVSNVSEAWVNSCEVRDELESPPVVTPFLCFNEARQFSQVSRIQANIVLVQIRVRIVSLLRCHIEMRHRHHDHFVRLRNDLKGITSLTIRCNMSWMTTRATLKMTETELTRRDSVRTVTHQQGGWVSGKEEMICILAWKPVLASTSPNWR